MDERPLLPDRSAWWYLVPVALFVVLASATALGALDAFRSVRENLVRTEFPGTRELTLDRSGTYTVFYEQRGGPARELRPEDAPPMQFSARAGDRALEVDPAEAGSSTTYSGGDTQAVAVARIDVPEPGTVTVEGSLERADAADTYHYTLIPNFGTQLVLGIGIILGGAFITIAATIISAILITLWRRKPRRAPAAA